MTDAVTPSPSIGGRRALRVGREVALWVGALVGVACLVLAVLGSLFDVRPVIFRSGSMEPTVGTGALGFTRTVAADRLAVGDIVTVRTSEGVRVTHRIRSISPNGEQVTLVLKGDANQVVDADPYVVSAADRMLFSVPRAGYVVSALGSRPATFAGGILVGLLLVTAFGRRRREEPSVIVAAAPTGPADLPVAAPGIPREVPGQRRPALAVAIGVAAAVLLVAGAKGTSAYFTDSATVNTGTFSSKAVVVPPAPVITGCVVANGGNPNRINWTYGTNPTTFEVRYTGNAHPAQSIAGNLRTSLLSVGLNNETGSFYLVAIVSGVASEPSNLVNYSGNGNGKVCAVQP